jgi:hypothetical protein
MGEMAFEKAGIAPDLARSPPAKARYNFVTLPPTAQIG